MKVSLLITLPLIALIASCDHSSPQDPADDAARLAQEAKAAADAVVTTDTAGGATPNAQPASLEANPADGRSAKEDLVKVFINASGQLCADIVSVRPLNAGNQAEVICQEHVNQPGRVTYEIDLSTERVVRR